jgi:hypothetical protein
VTVFGPVRSSDGPSRPRARLVARVAFRQRAATAWCARLHIDHPSRKTLFSSSDSAMASTTHLTSSTVSGTRSGS